MTETENKTGQTKFRKKMQKERKKNAFISILLSVLIPVMIAGASFFFCFFFINDDALMLGKLQGKNHFIVNRAAYLLRKPMPGDAVCYKKDGSLKIGRILLTPEDGIIQDFIGGSLYFTDGTQKKLETTDSYLHVDCLFGAVSGKSGYLILPDDKGEIPLISDNDIYDRADICGEVVFAWGNERTVFPGEDEVFEKEHFLFENKTADGVVESTGEYIGNITADNIPWQGDNPDICSLHGITIRSDIPVNTPIHIQKENGNGLLTTELSYFIVNKEDGTSDIFFELPKGYQGKYCMRFGLKRKTYITLETEAM